MYLVGLSGWGRRLITCQYRVQAIFAAQVGAEEGGNVGQAGASLLSISEAPIA